MAFPLPPNEEERLRVLRRYNILDTPAEQAFDRITNLAIQIFDVPIALVSLVDANRQFFKSCFGLDASETSRDVAFCTYAILQDEVFIVNDAHEDERFAQNPLVTGPPYIRFYAGAPLKMKDGVNLGTLCLIDRKPRPFSQQQQAMLVDLANMVVDEMDLRHEIQQRTAAEASLRDSEMRKSAILEAALDSIITIDESSSIVEFNASAERMFGYTREEVMGQLMADLIIPERYREAHHRGMKRYRATGKGPVLNRRIEIAALHADGTEFPIELAVSPLTLGDGRTFFTAHIRDITERKKGEQAIKESEAKSAALLEAIPDALFRVDHSGVFLDYIPADGFVPHDDPRSFLGKTVHDVMPESLADELLDYVVKTITTQQAQRHEYILPVGDEHRYFEARHVCDGPDTVLTMVRDVSDVHQAEKALRESESRYRYLVEKASDIIFLTDPRGYFTYANAIAQQITKRECVVGLHYSELVRPDKRQEVRRFYLEQIRNRVPTTYYEFPIDTKGDEEVWVGQSLQIVMEKGEVVGLQGVVRDITQRRRIEEALREALNKERELGELKTRFVSMVSHEFRTPLTMIHSSVHLARRFAKMGNPKAEKYLARIEDGVDEMTSLLEDVLMLGRMEASRLPFNPEELNVDTFLGELLGEIRIGVGQNHHVFVHGFERCTTVWADKKLLRIICNNLLTNAIKYSDKGSMINVQVACAEDTLTLKVSDRGMGIPEDDLARLFEAFHRASNVGNVQGTGLGLALTKRAVDQHGGHITVESTVGIGTTFSVALPLTAQAASIAA